MVLFVPVPRLCANVVDLSLNISLGIGFAVKYLGRHVRLSATSFSFFSETKDPIDLSDGTFFHYFDDLSVGGNAIQGLEFKRSYYSKSRLQDSGLGYGWGHNHSASISEITDGFAGLGEYSPTAAAAAITAMVAAHDILQSGHTLDKVMIATLIHSWLMDQLTENMVQVSFPGGSKRLIRYPDGTNGSDSCCDSKTLTKQTGERLLPIISVDSAVRN